MLALYARVSTADQSVEAQLDALRRYAAGRQTREYVDHGIRGAKASRPGFDALLAAARAGEITALVVTKLDRAARSLRNLLDVVAELERLGVAFVVLDQQIDTSTPTGRLLLHVLGSVAEFERDLISERTRGHLAHARSRGVVLGRRPRQFDVQAARELLASGRSQVAVARQIGVARSVLQRALAAHGG